MSSTTFDRAFEVNEKSDWDVHEFHVAHELGFVDRENLFDGFGFNKYFVFDEDIKPKRFLPLKAFVGYSYCSLRFGG